MIDQFNSGSKKDRKMYQEALNMQGDAKQKIEYLRMQQVRLRNQLQNSAGASNGSSE